MTVQTTLVKLTAGPTRRKLEDLMLLKLSPNGESLEPLGFVAMKEKSKISAVARLSSDPVTISQSAPNTFVLQGKLAFDLILSNDSYPAGQRVTVTFTYESDSTNKGSGVLQ